jgi:tetratricopeptide (TPR) repeat protein
MNRGKAIRFCAALAGMVLLCAGSVPPSGDVPAIIQKNYDRARHYYELHPRDDRAGWEFGRACFDRAEFSRNSAERASLAHQGIAACQQVITDQPNLAAGHYYLAMNLAQLARTKLMGALPILGKMENGWQTALNLDQKIDYAGPDRYLGMLYRDAPGWPISLGDKSKARHHLLHAVELCPNFPENYLDLIESYLMWDEKDAAARATDKLLKILPAARKEFADAYWQVSWKDWNQRLATIEGELNLPADPPLPRQK